VLIRLSPLGTPVLLLGLATCSGASNPGADDNPCWQQQADGGRTYVCEVVCSVPSEGGVKNLCDAGAGDAAPQGDGG
jgi:hypothetical protein